MENSRNALVLPVAILALLGPVLQLYTSPSSIPIPFKMLLLVTVGFLAFIAIIAIPKRALRWTPPSIIRQVEKPRMRETLPKVPAELESHEPPSRTGDGDVGALLSVEDFISNIVSGIASSRLQPPLGGELLRFRVHETVFQYPVEAVVAAQAGKYRLPNDPFNPVVKAVKVTIDASEGDTKDAWARAVAEAFAHVSSLAAILANPDVGRSGSSSSHVRVRSITSGVADWVPSVLKWLLPADSITVQESCIVLPCARLMLVTLTNSDFTNLGTILDQALYLPHPSNPGWTSYRSWLDISSTSMLGGRIIAYFKGGGSEGPDPTTIFSNHVRCISARLNELYGAPQ